MSDKSVVITSFDYGETYDPLQIVGVFLPAQGGFDTQRSGGASYAAGVGGIFKAVSPSASYASFKTFASGEAVCVIVPYFTWSGARNTSTATPDVLVGLNASDGTGSLKWVEGDGTTHDITPISGFIFSLPNAITCSYQHHIIVIGTVSGAPKCYRTTNRGSSWSEVTGRTDPTFVRTRRNDSRGITSGTNKGQCYLMDDGELGYTSVWASANFLERTLPAPGLVGLETIY